MLIRPHIRLLATALVVVMVLALRGGASGGQRPAPAGTKAEEQAREHLQKASDALREGRYDDAMKEFSAGYALLPRPGFVLNMGRVQRQAGNLAEARRYYRRYLDLEPGSPQRRQVEREIAEIDAALARGGAARQPQPTGATPPKRPASGPRNVVLTPAADDTEVPNALKAIAAPSAPAPAPTSDDEVPLYGRWWFWGTAAGVVVAGGLTFLLLRPHGEDYTTSGTWGALGR